LIPTRSRFISHSKSNNGLSLRAEGEAISGFKERLPRRPFGASRNDIYKETYETASNLFIEF